jgi:hypothetical protein
MPKLTVIRIKKFINRTNTSTGEGGQKVIPRPQPLLSSEGKNIIMDLKNDFKQNVIAKK